MPAITIAFRTRLWLVLALTTINSGLYMLVNAWPHGTPIMLPLNVIDRMLGWHAWTIWPYWALLLIGPLLALGLRERDVLLATARAYGVALTLNVTLWLSWPTHIVQRTLPSDLDALTTGAWHLLYTLDGPNNCFPSGHVTIPLVAASGLCVQYPRANRWLWPLLLGMLPSVVTTGQHYSWDILGGMATAACGVLIAGPWRVRSQR
ncbi:MAG: phosphatase PAP2 family protein [Burkholderiaceae bacterium]